MVDLDQYLLGGNRLSDRSGESESGLLGYAMTPGGVSGRGQGGAGLPRGRRRCGHPRGVSACAARRGRRGSDRTSGGNAARGGNDRRIGIRSRLGLGPLSLGGKPRPAHPILFGYLGRRFGWHRNASIRGVPESVKKVRFPREVATRGLTDSAHPRWIFDYSPISLRVMCCPSLAAADLIRSKNPARKPLA